MGQRAAGSGRRSAVVVLRMDASAGDTTSRPAQAVGQRARQFQRPGLDARRVGLLDQVQRPAQPAMPG